jgi:subtilisin-like proprotein convertase family protein
MPDEMVMTRPPRRWLGRIAGAPRALATGATPQPLVRAGKATVTPTTGNGNAFLEPGESGTLSVPAVNSGDGTAQGVSVRVRSTDPLVTITPGARAYGTIPAGGTVGRGFTIAVASTYPVGKPLALDVTVTFAGVLSPTASTVALSIGQPAATPTDIVYGGPALPIPDSDPAGVSVSLPVTGIGYAASFTFSVDGSACSADVGSTTVGIDHTYVADLIGTLTNPSGVTAQLFSRNGGGGNNLCQVVFDDTATSAFSSVTSADAPYTGSWKPADPLASLIRTPVDGQWTFTVSDNAGSDTGSVRAFSLHITGYEH